MDGAKQNALKRWPLNGTATANSDSKRKAILGVLQSALGFSEQLAKNNSPPSKTLVSTERVDHLDRLAREPMVVGQDDTLYFVTMSFDNGVGEGTRITIGVSKNEGATWSWKTLSENRFDDRPWVAVAADGTAHVIWNDGKGVCHAVSKDGGSSWNTLPRVHDQGGSSHLAIGPHGKVAVRITPLSASGNTFTPGVDLIAVSRDAGKAWRKYAAPGQRDWSPDSDMPHFPSPNLKGTPRWVEPVAWDASGALYYLWGSQKGFWLARSLDQGETWGSWHIIDRDEVSYFPYLIARPRRAGSHMVRG